ncbi:agmatinase family protein [Desertifilum sp. FACHB-1129]|uniref:Agmatinase n=1 Tax=Desertifilum tharense IPPAS B-1220 TaxID=1781255 RepID=A0A1E5QCT5_9CYAN|nr:MULTISPECIES: agmatinase family protein [Desertifilum]MDA0210473.1 agmatinase family protein [Cyanobacteria bacterium FC1]MBD2313889.1 agmatinase family protein [Desertifilum sp. FACHB-1129]MBD2324720.1 agmatinase family protein [Desertifilum sp. FACHB-866]MBD2334886.1 agmatinase family protein [Desertifilum sp. FACHB-868]OEJ72482.1 agmatinase [Desertifilum tharense IPPAS B-1220]
MATLAEILQNFDPNNIGVDNGNLLGLPFDYDSAQIIVFGIPWEVTVSYGTGTAQAPRVILDASRQLDIYDFDNPDGWKQGIFMAEIPQDILEKNESLRQDASRIIECLEQGNSVEDSPELTQILDKINQECQAVNQWLFTQAKAAMSQGKQVAIIGGDHSSPLGYMQALAEQYPDYGILHIDAHADLRNAYEGFEFSHASIMFNALKLPQISKLVQVGIRDFCHDEVKLIQQSNGRVSTYYDPMLKQKLYAGIPWLEVCKQIVSELPQNVYISFDVDGLDPKLCPSTGTPVPGGLELEQVYCLFREVVHSGRQIIGFDVCEVGNAEWDGNVGARAVYKLCNLMSLSQNNRK